MSEVSPSMRMDTRCSSRSRASRAGVSLLRKSHTGLETVTLFLQVPPQAAILDRTNDTAPRVKGTQGVGGSPFDKYQYLLLQVLNYLYFLKVQPPTLPPSSFSISSSFKPQHPQRSKEVCKHYYSHLSQASVLVLLSLLPRSQKQSAPPSPWAKIGFCKREGDF